MSTDIPLLTFAPQPGAVVCDLDQLMTSKLLIQANSGGGKSYAIRYILEQTHGQVQQLVLDPEGEFASLRERFPYVLAGAEGDVPADPATAAQLCQRLLELQTSAVVDLYDLHLDQRRRFVRHFLDALIHLPRELWHPVMVVLDEAHRFAPERGEVESTQAVIALAAEGRKRPFSAVIATQRLAKLHKDVAAELNNKLIGRTGLDVDLRRAGDDLGFDKDRRLTLKDLDPGTFYAFGPAISREVVLVRTGAVQTTHPEPGTVAPPAPPPPEQIKQLLGQLADLPAQAEPAGDLVTAQRRIAELEQQLRLAGEVIEAKPAIERLEVPVLRDDQVEKIEQLITNIAWLGAKLTAIGRDLGEALARVAAQPAPSQPTTSKATQRRTAPKNSAPAAARSAQRPIPKRKTAPKAAAADEIAQTLAIPAIAAKVVQAQTRLDDARARGHVPRILRALWTVALRPEELAEGRGTASNATVTRLRKACRALQQQRLLVDVGDGRLRVNHEELDRLRELDRTLRT